MNTKGDYFKLCGGFDGVFWNGKAWERFDCEACVREAGLAINRRQGPMTNSAAKAMLGPVLHRHDKDRHQAYLMKARQA